MTENTLNDDDFFSLKKAFNSIDYSTQYIKIFSDYREQLLAPYKQQQKLLDELFAPRKALIDSIKLPKIDYNKYLSKNDYSTYFSSVFDNLPKLDNTYISDFRINALNQSIIRKQHLFFEQINNASKPIIDELNVEFDELISETFTDTTHQNKQENDITDIKNMILHVYRSQENLKETIHNKFENHENESPVEQSSKKVLDNLHSLLLALFTILSLVSTPKDVYESLVWYIEILNHLIKILTNN